MDDERPFSGFKEVPHTADIAIDVFASNLPELFNNAAQGLYHILGIRTGTGEVDKVDLEMEEMDRESLLVSFLGELLYYADKGKAAVGFDIKVNKNKLKATLSMRPLESYKVEVKAITYNQLKIIENGQQMRTRIVFDI
jgi:SHS2 domain-containing protein